MAVISVSVCLSACLSVCLSVCLPACLSVCLSVCLPVCLWFSLLLLLFASYGGYFRPTEGLFSPCLFSACGSLEVGEAKTYSTTPFLSNKCILV